MKKIPTIFLRRFGQNVVINSINPVAQWVFDGEGIAMRKMDGTCCLIRDRRLYKRREGTEKQFLNNELPADFEVADRDPITAKVVGWVPVGNGPEDRWHRKAFQDWQSNGTYELVGPKVQGNPEKLTEHHLIGHDAVDLIIDNPPERTFEDIGTFLGMTDIEGIVYHHPDGRMAKIKGKDFGFKRGSKS